MFVHHSVQGITRSPSESGSPRQTGYGHSRGSSSDSHFSPHNNRASMPSQPTYSAQISVFVVFEKKAGLIRIADAAVTEVEMYDAGSSSGLLGSGSFTPTKDTLSVGSSLSSRRSRASIDFMAFKEARGTWILPSLVDLPAVHLPGGDMSPSQSVYVLTRGKHTHIVPAPLPAVIQHVPPIHTFVWSSAPTRVSARVCLPPTSPRTKTAKTPPFVQLIAFGEDGIEAQEIPLTALGAHGKGKGKGVALADPCRGQSFIGETGFLTQGGHWHRFPVEMAGPLVLERTDSTSSARSFESVHTDEVVARLKVDAGAYGWLRKSVEDWRVFWVGGDTRDVEGREEEEDGVLV